MTGSNARIAAVVAGVAWLRKTTKLVSLTRSLAAPRWTATPNGYPEVSEALEGDEEVWAEVDLSREGREVLERLIDEISPYADADEIGPVRRTSCWLCGGGVLPHRAATVRVFVGKYEVGILRAGREARLAGEVLRVRGGSGNCVGTFAEVRGDEVEGAVLAVFFASSVPK